MATLNKNSTGQTEVIEADAVERLVSRLRATRRGLEEGLQSSDEKISPFEDGWRLAPYDPNRLLSACEHIRLRDGVKLASYQLRDGMGNGNGFALVIPADRALPDPRGKIEMGWDGPTPVFRIADMAAPEWIHQDVSQFLEADRSMQSYFEASIFLRELRELGAMWHGCSWDTHEILTAPKASERAPWTWHAPEPREWRPSVMRVTRQTVRAEFFSYSEMGEQQIVKHTDSYTHGYRLRTREITIGTGGPGFIF